MGVYMHSGQERPHNVGGKKPCCSIGTSTSQHTFFYTSDASKTISRVVTVLDNIAAFQHTHSGERWKADHHGGEKKEVFMHNNNRNRMGFEF